MLLQPLPQSHGPPEGVYEKRFAETENHHTRLVEPRYGNELGNELGLFFGTVCSFATQIVGITQVLQRQREPRANFVFAV
jgi:hypothetical protein